MSFRRRGATLWRTSRGTQAVKEDLRTVPVVKVEEDTRKNAITLLDDEQDAWSAPKEEAVAPSVAIAAAKTPVSETVEDVKTRGDDKTELDVTEPAQATATKDVEQPVVEENKSTSQAEEENQQQRASKVQELVDMYDGITKKAVRPPPDTIAREAKPKGSVGTSREDESMVESETVQILASEEEAVQPSDDTNHSTTTVETNSPVKDNEESKPAPESDTVEDEAKIDSAEVAEESKINDIPTPPSIDDEQSPVNSTKSDTKPPLYPVDLSNLDALFPGSKPSTTNPEPVPDVIIDNSYTTTSERKTWYRISRFGSMRKHDSGDEDNYKRITWANSQVHDKTLHIQKGWPAGRQHVQLGLERAAD
ncbi:hypothetical protein NLG97_g11311 [Lecanicillium saksenae]|uniref:Uncharacterized protein n=1 Tax=Lecanicillium saksenae TaxID=468837 RepID=A0ACC1QCE6_9HYPO|nr:hypothetical protein NLG97_g11311 [Lecanicillium saksenae]